MKADILFSAASRPEFTLESLIALRDNTDWSLVSRLWLYLERSADPETSRIVSRFCLDFPFNPLMYECGDYGGPVAVMVDYLGQQDAGEVFAKVDNDVIVPPGWLNSSLGVMDRHPELDLLGIEPPLSRTPAPWANGKPISAPEYEAKHVYSGGFCGYAPCAAIGGVGLMRKRAFIGRQPMRPHATYGGFTDWQMRNTDVVKGWIVPPLSLFLLDRLPINPWATISKQYVRRKWQRPWTMYGPEAATLWEWWKPSGAGSI